MTRGKSKSTQDFEQAILDIVAERHPINVRGIAYGLFTLGYISSMHRNNTNKVSRVSKGMRERGELDWSKIVDDSRRVQQAALWINPSELIQASVDQYRRDYWQDQPTIVEVWAEKATVQGVLGPILDKYGVPFRVMKGFGSFTAIKNAAQASLRARNAGKEFHAIYLGDYDPSGMYMSEIDLPRRFRKYGGIGAIERIAVIEQDHNLPSFGADDKTTDTRYEWYADKFGQDCWELDAINPNDLRKRLSEQIEACLNLDTWDRAIEVEAAEIESMQDFHKTWQEMMSQSEEEANEPV